MNYKYDPCKCSFTDVSLRNNGRRFLWNRAFTRPVLQFLTRLKWEHADLGEGNIIHLDKRFVRSLNVLFFLFLSLSLSHTSVFLPSFVLQRKGEWDCYRYYRAHKINLELVQTGKRDILFYHKDGNSLLKEKKKKSAQNLLTLSSFFIFC